MPSLMEQKMKLREDTAALKIQYGFNSMKRRRDREARRRAGIAAGLSQLTSDQRLWDGAATEIQRVARGMLGRLYVQSLLFAVAEQGLKMRHAVNEQRMYHEFDKRRHALTLGVSERESERRKDIADAYGGRVMPDQRALLARSLGLGVSSPGTSPRKSKTAVSKRRTRLVRRTRIVTTRNRAWEASAVNGELVSPSKEEIWSSSPKQRVVGLTREMARDEQKRIKEAKGVMRGVAGRQQRESLNIEIPSFDEDDSTRDRSNSKGYVMMTPHEERELKEKKARDLREASFKGELRSQGQWLKEQQKLLETKPMVLTLKQQRELDEEKAKERWEKYKEKLEKEEIAQMEEMEEELTKHQMAEERAFLNGGVGSKGGGVGSFLPEVKKKTASDLTRARMLAKNGVSPPVSPGARLSTVAEQIELEAIAEHMQEKITRQAKYSHLFNSRLMKRNQERHEKDHGWCFDMAQEHAERLAVSRAPVQTSSKGKFVPPKLRKPVLGPGSPWGKDGVEDKRPFSWEGRRVAKLTSREPLEDLYEDDGEGSYSPIINAFKEGGRFIAPKGRIESGTLAGQGEEPDVQFMVRPPREPSPPRDGSNVIGRRRKSGHIIGESGDPDTHFMVRGPRMPTPPTNMSSSNERQLRGDAVGRGAHVLPSPKTQKYSAASRISTEEAGQEGEPDVIYYVNPPQEPNPTKGTPQSRNVMGGGMHERGPRQGERGSRRSLIIPNTSGQGVANVKRTQSLKLSEEPKQRRTSFFRQPETSHEDDGKGGWHGDQNSSSWIAEGVTGDRIDENEDHMFPSHGPTEGSYDQSVKQREVGGRRSILMPLTQGNNDANMDYSSQMMYHGGENGNASNGQHDLGSPISFWEKDPQNDLYNEPGIEIEAASLERAFHLMLEAHSDDHPRVNRKLMVTALCNDQAVRECFGIPASANSEEHGHFEQIFQQIKYGGSAEVSLEEFMSYFGLRYSPPAADELLYSEQWEEADDQMEVLQHGVYQSPQDVGGWGEELHLEQEGHYVLDDGASSGNRSNNSRVELGKGGEPDTVYFVNAPKDPRPPSQGNPKGTRGRTRTP